MSGKNTGEKVSEIDGHVSKQYDIVRRLGKGAYGIVWKAVEKKSKETVAMKKIFDAFRNQTDAQRTFREIMFLLSFSNHENIIRLIGLHKANNDRDIYLVFEYMETDLHNVIKKGNILKDIHKVFIMYQLFKAIKYIHSGNVIHRDLKPSNVLLNAQCHCKIADFGLARSVTQIGEGDGETGSDPTLTDYVATRWYRAPEILVASKRYTKGIDMWSLGCILGEMLRGEPLFPGSSTINQVERIMATLPPPTQQDLISVSAGYGTNLLEKTPGGPRRTLRDLLPGVTEKALNLICSLIVFNPTHRLTAVEALEHPYVADFHRRSNEPERGSSVVPLLRDDVQLSVEEYRNKLYAMMDDKHRKHKNMSKSRIKRLSEHIRKETSSNTCNPVIGQGDAAVSKNIVSSCDDLGKERTRSNAYQPARVEGRATLPSRKTLRQSQIDSDERIGISRAKNATVDSQIHDDLKSRRPNTKHVATQYTYNLMNGNLSTIPPGVAKSCLYLNQQQQLSKSQRSIQSDQVAVYAVGGRSSQLVPGTRARLRRSCKQIRVPARGPHFAETASRQDDDRGACTLVGRSPESLETKYFARTAPSHAARRHVTGNAGKNLAGSNSNSAESSYGSYRSTATSQAIRNYLNQTVPQSQQRRASRSEGRSSSPYRTRDTVDYRTRLWTSAESTKRLHPAGGTAAVENARPKGPTINCCQIAKIQTGHGAEERKSIRDARFLSSYSQSHGVIAASAYKDLRDGAMRW